MKDLRKAPLEAAILFSRTIIIFLFWTFAPLYFKLLNYSGLQIGILMSTFPATAFLVTIPFGIFSDRVEQKKLVSLGFLFIFIFLFGLTRSTDFWLVLLFFLAGGIGSNLIVTPIFALIYKTLKKDHKGRIMGSFAAIEHFAVAIGLLIGGYLILRTSFNFIFKIGMIAAIPLFFLSRYLFNVKLFSFSFQTYEKDFLKKPVIIFSIILFLFAFHWGAESTSMALFLKENVGLIESQIGFFLAIIVLTLAMVELITGFAFDRKLGVSFLLISSLLASAFGNLVLFFTNNLIWVFLARWIHVFGDAGITIFSATVVATLFTKKRMGGDRGIVGFISTSGTIFGAITCGILGAALGYGVPFLIAGLLSLLAIIIYLVSGIHYKK